MVVIYTGYNSSSRENAEINERFIQTHFPKEKAEVKFFYIELLQNTRGGRGGFGLERAHLNENTDKLEKLLDGSETSDEKIAVLLKREPGKVFDSYSSINNISIYYQDNGNFIKYK